MSKVKLTVEGYKNDLFKFVSDMPHIKVKNSYGKKTAVSNRPYSALTKMILNELKK